MHCRRLEHLLLQESILRFHQRPLFEPPAKIHLDIVSSQFRELSGLGWLTAWVFSARKGGLESSVAVITIVFRTAATTAAVPEGHRMYAVRHDASCDPLRRCALADLIHPPRN